MEIIQNGGKLKVFQNREKKKKYILKTFVSGMYTFLEYVIL